MRRTHTRRRDRREHRGRRQRIERRDGRRRACGASRRDGAGARAGSRSRDRAEHGRGLGNAPYVLYLNDDVFAEPGAIGTLLETLERRPDAVAAGGRLVEPDLTTQDQYRPRPFPSRPAVVARLFGLERLWPRNPWTGDAPARHARRSHDGRGRPARRRLPARPPVRRRAHRRLGRALLVLVRGRRLLAPPGRHGASLYVPTAPFATSAARPPAPKRRRATRATSTACCSTRARTSRVPAVRSSRPRCSSISLGRAALRAPRDRAGARIYLAPRAARSRSCAAAGSSALTVRVGSWRDSVASTIAPQSAAFAHAPRAGDGRRSSEACTVDDGVAPLTLTARSRTPPTTARHEVARVAGSPLTGAGRFFAGPRLAPSRSRRSARAARSDRGSTAPRTIPGGATLRPGPTGFR